MQTNTQELLTIEELSRFLKFSRGTIYNKVHKREIPFCKVGGALRFDRATIVEWIEAKIFSPIQKQTVS